MEATWFDRLKQGALAILVGILCGYWWTHRPVTPAPGILTSTSPVQAEVKRGTAAPFQHGAFTVLPLATFRIEARVLGRERYWQDGHEAELSPLDLALGWGPMSDSAVIDQLEITQGGRWYHWRTRGDYPIPRRDIEQNSANMHLLPATDAVRSAMLAARVGQVVSFSGWLVEARAADGWYWRSSLTRDDVGDHACEVVWVTAFQVR